MRRTICRPHGYNFFGYAIPARMGDGILLYVEHHIQPGDFLTAVICNDLKGACARADDENLQNLPAFVAWFYNYAPAGCWGSPELMSRWLRADESPLRAGGGLEGERGSHE